MDSPFGLLAELTYRCPLHCPYCSNPVDLSRFGDELTPTEWQRTLREARDLGVWQVHFSGGEPLLYRDLTALVATASELGLYTNLITSALGLSPRRAQHLREAGLDHVQISVQAAHASDADRIAGIPAWSQKRRAAALVREMGWPLTLNVVLHRGNIDQLPDILAMATELGATRIELAHTQYYGWALLNRAALLPSRTQLTQARGVVDTFRSRAETQMEVIYVTPDYYSTYPKPCMSGWGRRQMTVSPNGDVLPCPASGQLAGSAPNVRSSSLRAIWEESPLFNLFRGTEWMPEPCRSCHRAETDFGGCRCQAYQLTGDASRTDPVCHLSPDHHLVLEAVAAANSSPESQHAEPLRPRTWPGQR